ncbi:hypothetical protein HUJ04_011429 [Dendroctonus ponderosae]|nr:hypothetical protein HUJ04_011429 [Dendroctonus ponderosae]KAH1028618.1 hypothetical protein HUJ05_001957 [Dendroctonus ponderosae]
MNEHSSIRAMDGVKNAFNSFADVIDKDMKGVHFSKFKRPGDIPNHFIQERRELTGLVKRIDPNGGLLLVEHKPLLDISWISSGQLPIRISGVKVAGLGLNWLQAIVVGNQIKFIPVAKDPNFLQCEVLLVQNTKDKKEDLLNVGERLIKIGFGQTEPVQPPLSFDPRFLIYYKRLQKAESIALRNKLGLKYYIKPAKSALSVLIGNLRELSERFSQTTRKHIKNVPNISST